MAMPADFLGREQLGESPVRGSINVDGEQVEV
jgi:hypothetical protein